MRHGSFRKYRRSWRLRTGVTCTLGSMYWSCPPCDWAQDRLRQTQGERCGYDITHQPLVLSPATVLGTGLSKPERDQCHSPAGSRRTHIAALCFMPWAKRSSTKSICPSVCVAIMEILSLQEWCGTAGGMTGLVKT